jgi:hypothetical protein
LLLNVIQSVPVSAPVVVELAVLIPNTPVVLLYVSGPSAEREVRLIFHENARKLAGERAPVTLLLARAREIPVPEIESPLGVPDMTPILLLKIVQSLDLRSPVAVADAFGILSTTVPPRVTDGVIDEVLPAVPRRKLIFPSDEALFQIGVLPPPFDMSISPGFPALPSSWSSVLRRMLIAPR